ANGIGGASTWTQLVPTGSAPAPRAFPTAALDPGTNHLIVFGGYDLQSTVFNDVWSLSPTAASCSSSSDQSAPAVFAAANLRVSSGLSPARLSDEPVNV